ncbi:MAG: GMP synthase subunit A [Candidatus Methanoplasma sp.]|jgi:GMP synthase (glutamine-hydrolysing)|nr:GMP synthase subunit A [Candidatus Methanoplasma sp.]
MRVYVVDNGGQWTHREWRVLKYLGVDAKIVPNTTPFSELADLDGLVLSGGAPSVASDAGRMGSNAEYLDKAEYPILGICAGMQFLSEHFGGSLGPGVNPEFGKVGLKVSDHTDLFRNLPSEFNVWASHNDEVKTVPPGFVVTASSDTCPVEAVRSLTRPIYGVQFHPEVENTENGPQIFRNFLDIISERR